MPRRFFLAMAGLSGALAVAVDAAATHLLAGDLYRLDLAATSARYGMIHAAALLALALLAERADGFWLAAAGWCFVAGIALFCGSLDLLAAGAPHGFAAAAPWGGTAFIVGWLAVAVAALRAKKA
ncbi:MAG TPA: DUF423 domain-containing protein [Stellaceae bacterium]|nr:DUF423 domain-containing protein [Stellaceae bacterium]